MGISYKLYIKILLLVVLFLGSSAAKAQQDFMFFDTLPEDYLPSGEVSSLYQDREGFLWIATYDGVVRYDGYQSVKYELSSEDENTYELFHGLCEDKEGNLYVGTERGLLMVDKINKKIVALDQPEIQGLNVNDIITDESGRVWVCGDYGVFRQDVNGKFMRQELRRSSSEEPLTGMVDMAIDNQDNLWITSWNKGLCRYDLNTGRIYRYSHGDLQYSYVLHCDEQSNLWIGTWGKGLLKVSPQDMTDEKLTYVKYVHQPWKSTSLLDDVIYDIDQDPAGNIWVGSRSGLSILSDPERGVFRNEFPKDTYGSLPFNEVNAILKTTDGTMWLGMMGGGVCRTDFMEGAAVSGIVFMNIDNVRDKYKTSSVRSIHQIDPNMYWFGLAGRGMIMYDLRTTMFSNYSDMPCFAGFPTISTVDCIHRRRSTGEYCFGTYENGLWLYSAEKDLATVINSTTRSNMSDDCIQVLEEDSSENIWIGTIRGFYVMDTLNVIHSLSGSDKVFANCKISDISADSSRANTVWMATDCHGVLRAMYTDEEIKVKPYAAEGKRNVTQFVSVYADSRGNVWAGSAHDGLYLYNEKGDRFDRVDTYAFLDGKSVLNISEGPKGDIWVTTEDMVFSFDDTQLLFYHNLTGNDKFSSFNRNTSLYLPEENKMVYGYNRGIALFPTGNVVNKESSFKVAITDFVVNKFNVGVSFSLFKFKNTFDALYAYRLTREGDPAGKWYITNGRNNVARFPDLKAGDYTFEVCGRGYPTEAFSHPTVYTFKIESRWQKLWMLLPICLLVLFAVIKLVRPYRKEIVAGSENMPSIIDNGDSEMVEMSFEVRRVELTPPNQLFIQKVLRVVNEHIADSEFRQADFAREMAMSQTVLTEKIKAMTGNTPMAFLTNTRLQMAYTMINEVKDGIQVADLAYSVGFNDAKYFSKKFKEKYGISPNKMMTRQSVENV
jgi:ligand-binding sensor domain-containing protein/AraC-like DNA-binding protein